MQQVTEQLEGDILINWRINHGRIFLHQEVEQYFPKTISVIEEFKKDIQKVIKEYPEIIKKPEIFENKDGAVET